MSDLLILQRFKDYFELNHPIFDIQNHNHESVLIGVFVRQEFLALSCSGSTSSSFSESINYIEQIFSLADSGKVDANIPFLLIEDFIEFGSYEALKHLLPYLDVKSKLWASVFSNLVAAHIINILENVFKKRSWFDIIAFR